MNCKIRKWSLSDAKNLAAAVSNKKVQDNLRDGLPYPYTEQDGTDFISAMLSADENDIFAFAITADGKPLAALAFFAGKIYIDKLASWAIILPRNAGAKALPSKP